MAIREVIEHRSSRNAQAEMIDHGFEVRVSMKQDMIIHDVERINDQIDRFTHAHACGENCGRLCTANSVLSIGLKLVDRCK